MGDELISRVSLEWVHGMLRSTAHDDLDGDEGAWQRAVELEWETVRQQDSRAPYVVCADAGHPNAHRLRQIAGGSAFVEPLYHRSDAMCSIAGLDAAAAQAIRNDGRYEIIPLPHVAKLSPALAMGISAASSTSRSGGGSSSSSSGSNTSPAGDSAPSLPVPQELLDSLSRGSAYAIALVLTPGVLAPFGVGETMGRRWLADLRRRGARRLRERYLFASDRHSASLLDAAAAEAELTATAAGQDHTNNDDNARRLRKSTERRRLRTSAWRRLTNSSGPESLNNCDFSQFVPEGTHGGRTLLLHLSQATREVEGNSKGRQTQQQPSGACVSALLAYLTTRPEVAHIEMRHTAHTFNLEEAWVAQSGTEDYWPLWAANLTGEGQVIGMADTGVDKLHCFFREPSGVYVTPSSYDSPITDLTRRKIVQYIDYQDSTDAVDGHGTHVAGTLLGSKDGINDPESYDAGGAYNAKLAFFDFGDSSAADSLKVPTDIPNVMLAPALSAGAYIHSDSWGTTATSYSDIDKAIDDYVHTNQRFLMVVAAGNCGASSSSTSSQCSGMTGSESIMSPALAKNVIGVGASQSPAGGSGYDIGTVAFFSSQGPTRDGRIKPDLVAPGDPIISSESNGGASTSCGTFSELGTSMATPVVAASAALARQYFMEGWYQTGLPDASIGFEPSAALLKAVLINSAQPMTAAECDSTSGSCSDATLQSPPDAYQGHGRIAMDQGLNVNKTVGLYLRDWVNVTEGQTLTYNVTILAAGDPTKDLRVTLVWSDPPGFVAASHALVHDLDLKVTHYETGDVYYPNGFSKPDTNNNVEKVTVSSAVPDHTYVIEVTGTTVTENNGLQAFALVANGEFIKTIDPPQPPPEPSSSNNNVGGIPFSWETIIFAGVALVAVAILCCAGRFLFCRRRGGGSSNGRGGGGGGRRGSGQRSSSGVAVVAVANGVNGNSASRRRSSGSGGAGSKRHDRHAPPLPAGGPVVLIPSPVGESATSSDSDTAVVRAAGLGAASGGGQWQAYAPPPPAGSAREVCPECGAVFNDVVDLVDHVEAFHDGIAHRQQPISIAIPVAVSATAHQ